jgi:iron complex outermembrane receptor protein
MIFARWFRQLGGVDAGRCDVICLDRHPRAFLIMPAQPTRRLVPMPRRLRACALAAAALAVASASHAQGRVDQQIVITGSIFERAALDAPYAIGSVDAQALRSSGPMVNLSEAMARVPGLTVANRNNYAQDLQISSRGFGARAGFGVRGVRLYTDGIPASMPDGQGQVSHFDLAGAQRVEVLRGPFSVLYGNSSGGVIAAVSAPQREGRFETALDAGRFGLRQWRLSGGAPLGDGLEARVGASGLEWDGFRPQSSAEKVAANGRLAWQSGRDRLVVIANVLDQPADDPLGLQRDQFDADPRQSAPQATLFDTRKTVNQQQVGARWSHRYPDGSALAEAAVTAYHGERSVTQFLAIAAGTQNNPRHGGGVIDFDRSYNGVDLRATWRLGAASLVTGAAIERQRDARRGYLNYTGTVAAPAYGVIGTLRRDESNGATTRDVYAQAELPLGEAFAFSAGVRAGRVKLTADDHYLANGDDSGSRTFSYTNPVLGVRWQAARGLNLHASVARGFESPTLGELAYRPDGSGGFNTALDPQGSRQAEIGAKWRSADGAIALDAALFRITVDDEIGVATNAGGRQSFQNVGRTLREGGELSLAWRFAPQWRAQAALTLLDATYRDGFLACSGIPCTLPTPAQPAGQNLVPVPAGNRIAGTQRGLAYAELAWQPSANTELGVELRSASALSANDLNTEAAARYTLLALRATQRYTLPGGFGLELLARLDNATDKVYAGSVIVNEANQRYFEPGSPRSWLVSARLSRAF